MMNRFCATIAMAMLLAGCGGDAADDETAEAPISQSTGPYSLAGVDGVEVGSVDLSQDPNGVTISVSVSGLSEGLHAVHLHETGDCSAGDFTSAGGHWNPTGAQHGRDNPEGAHLGDLANMSVGADGTGESNFLVTQASLDGGQYSIADADGTALVIHAGPDDYRTDPAGDAGSRVACAVVAAPQ
ncbi:superoxide dismutase family protein [Sphingomicrobium sediminis]|uniref:Superoxide dismutase [Cu-Zn] n=1 Tax=Sphingomicrobium sediminis TaxID=2950949 RepID=A0A9X2EF14_9SPHN|nr:superoxide dismutase family protein [Sphingomicrobium sediminis]MCM8556385.1 superoxide dismutase family protein [Sphingomicrobium sediminis]